MLNHQLGVLKEQQTNLERKKNEKQNYRKKFKSKRAPKLADVAPVASANGFQKLITQKQKKRERLYSDNPELLV